MKKLLLFILFIGLGFGLPTLTKAQEREKTILSKKSSDDGVLLAYPNPAKDFLVFKAKDPSLKVKSVFFYSILGTQVAQYSMEALRGEINIEKLKPGKYLIRYVLSDGTQKVTQIVKQ